MIPFIPLIVLAAPVLAAAEPSARSVLPYRVEKKTLANGLDVLAVETPEFKDVVNVATLILAGSRNENEKGRSGLAHLFEHMAFRHRFEEGAASYGSRMEAMGAFDNAWTWFDITYYHPVTFSSNLDELTGLQAERFLDMKFSERIYRTEAGAVLGEYRKSASDPSLRMEEVQCDLLYGQAHGYGHTTLGYLADVEDMPNSFAAGKAFYETYYRPSNAVVIVAGDVKAPVALAAVEKAYRAWKPGKIPDTPPVKPPGEPRHGHVDWDSDVAPRVSFAYLVPAFHPGSKEAAVLSIAPELLAGKTAPLYRRLRYETKAATDLGVDARGSQGFDPRPLEVLARLDKERFDREGKALLDAVEKDLEAGFEELKAFSKRPGAEKALAALKSKFRNDLLSGLNSPERIAAALAWYYRFTRDPGVLDAVVNAVDGLTPPDVDAFAAQHFVPGNRVTVTMTAKAVRG